MIDEKSSFVRDMQDFSITVVSIHVDFASIIAGQDNTVKPLYNDHLSYCDKWYLKTHDFLILLIISIKKLWVCRGPSL